MTKRGGERMKAKLIIVLLIGLLVGILLGGFLGQVSAVSYDEIYYLKKIYNTLDDIASDVDDIEDWAEYIYYNM